MDLDVGRIVAPLVAFGKLVRLWISVSLPCSGS